ncbi:MAG: NmrA family NAD(P)-binding protein [Luteibacter sp.]
MTDIFLITGASGKLGGLVIDHLLARGVAPGRIVAGSRTPDTLRHLADRGVALRKVDFDDAPGLADAFQGVHTLLIISTDSLTADGRRIRQHGNAVEAAVAAGVARLAYTSLPEPTRSPLSFAPDHAGTEEAIRRSGIPSTIFRNGWYQENLFMGLPSHLQTGTWYTSSEGGKIAYAAREEMAEAMAAALIDPPAGSNVFTLTGSEVFSVDEIAALAREATGRPLEVINVTDQQLAAGLRAAGVPEEFVTLLVSVEAATRAGTLGTVTGDMEALIGRPLRPLAEFFRREAGALLATHA